MAGGCCFGSPSDIAPMDVGEMESSEIYEDGDICDHEVDVYREKVEKRITDTESICSEFKVAATMNYHNKLEVLCESTLNQLELHSDKLLGMNGRTLLHIALGLKNIESAKVLIKHGSKELVLAQLSGRDYGGMTALHLAIVNGETEIIESLLQKIEDEREKVAFVNFQTYGKNFRNMTNIPVALCLWCGHGDDVYGLLVDTGAELDAVDRTTGNTALHSLVLYSTMDSDLMIESLNMALNHDATRRWWCMKNNLATDKLKFGPKHWQQLKKHLLSISNNEGYTPLTLAALHGSPDILIHLCNIEQVTKNTIWNYGPCSANLYDVSEIDPLVVETGKPAILDIVVYHGNDEMLSVIASEPIYTLIQTKWKSHRLLFHGWLVYHFLLMSTFTWWAVERPLQDIYNNSTAKFLPGDLTETQSLAVECVILVAACLYILTEIIDIASSLHDVVQFRLLRRSTGYYKAPWSVLFRFDDFRVILMTFSVCTVIASILRHRENENSDILSCVALTCGWYYMLAFLRTFRAFSYYTVMVHRIIFSDILRFGGVFIFILLGFTAGNMVIFATAPNGVPDQLSSFEVGMLSLFRLMIGLEEWSIPEEARSEVTAQIVFLAFVLLTTILLLNMLIASMTDTYAAVSDRESLRLKFLALTCMTMERRLMPLECCRNYQASTYLHRHEGKGKHIALLVEKTTSS